MDNIGILNDQNEERYCVESPGGISPASSDGSSVLRYKDTSVSAGITYQGKGYRTICLGFPIEVITDDDDIRDIMASCLSFLEK